MAKVRLQTHRDREKTLDQLQNSLASAADIFSTKADDVDETNYKCEGAVQALIAICNYLKEEKFAHRHVEPLKALVGALADADEGTENEITSIRKSNGASPRQHERSAVLGFACAIVTLLIGNGIGLKEATSQVARVLNQFGIRVGKSREGNEATALKNWRKKLMGGKQGNIARGVYDASNSSQYKDLPPRELLNILRKHLANKVP